jgi:predicted kinase
MYKSYAPYFRNGKLFLPRQTVTLLIAAGLNSALAEQALHGLALDDQREEIGIISKALEQALYKLEIERQAYETLSSAETHFMLTPVQVTA